MKTAQPDPRSPSGGRGKQRGPREPFGKPKQRKVLDEITAGRSKITACALAMVNRKTVDNWLRSGRSNKPKHPEHARFAKEFELAEAKARADAYDKAQTLADEDPRAALALLGALDDRFGPGKEKGLKVERMTLENELLRIKVEAARDAMKDGGVAAFILGVEAIFDDISEGARNEVSNALMKRGLKRAEPRDLGAEPSPTA